MRRRGLGHATIRDLGWGLALVAFGGGSVGAQVVPQRGSVATEMDADSLVAWSVRLGVAGVPVVGGEAFEDLAGGWGVRGGASVRFGNGHGAELTGAWLTLADDLSGGRASLVEAALGLLWSVSTAESRLEAGPLFGLVGFSRDDLATRALGGLAGAGLRAERRVNSRLTVGVAADVLWARFGQLEFVEPVPPDPDGRADGVRVGFDLYGSVAFLRR